MTPEEPGSPYDVDLMAAVTELGDALRALVDTSVRTTVEAGELRAASGQARAMTARLGESARPTTRLPVLDDPVAFRRVYNPVSGVGSALAPPLEMRRDADGAAGTAVLGPAYEGPPGHPADRQEAYFGAITDASGRHSPPGRPTDATAVR